MSRCGSGWLLAAAVACACRANDPPSRTLVFDFEEGDEGWQTTAGNVQGHISLRRSPLDRHARGFIGTGETSDGKWDIELHGVLSSPSFVVDHDYLVFRMGGSGSSKQCFVEVREPDNNQALRKIQSTGRRGMETHIVDVEDLLGMNVRLQLVDRSNGEPCSIHIDWVRLVDG